MEESEDHLQTTESNSLEDRRFLLLIFHIDGVVKDRVVRHCFLDVEAQFYDESEDFVVAVIYARDQRGHAPEVLCREHLHRFGTEVAFDVIHLLRILQCIIHCVFILMVTDEQELHHLAGVAPYA